MNPVFFSLIVPTYNRASLIGATIQSLLRQEFHDFEIIVVDDGGSDHTKEVVEQFKDPRVQYNWKKNAERGAARNYGAALARGKYLNFFDSDDLAYPNHLSTAYSFIMENKDAIAFHTSFDWKDSELTPFGTPGITIGDLNKRIFKNNMLSCNNVFIEKGHFEKLKFSENRALSGSEDWLLWLRIACRYPVSGIGIITSTIVQHDARSMSVATGDSTQKRADAFKEEIEKDDWLVKERKDVYKKAVAELYYLTALFYSVGGKVKLARHYAVLALKYYPFIVFTRRTLAIVKHALKS